MIQITTVIILTAVTNNNHNRSIHIDIFMSTASTYFLLVCVCVCVFLFHMGLVAWNKNIDWLIDLSRMICLCWTFVELRAKPIASKHWLICRGVANFGTPCSINLLMKNKHNNIGVHCSCVILFSLCNRVVWSLDSLEWQFECECWRTYETQLETFLWIGSKTTATLDMIYWAEKF